MIITVSGMPGAGKSTIAKALSESLGYKRYYVGGMRRELAKKKGMTLEEYNKLGETDPSTDKEVDELQKSIADKEDNVILEGRTSYFLVPDSIKLFIDVDFMVGAERIYRDLHDKAKAAARNESDAQTLEEVKASLKKRISSDRLRYNKYYGIKDAYEKSQFDIVLDTTDMSIQGCIDEALRLVLEEMKKRHESSDK